MGKKIIILAVIFAVAMVRPMTARGEEKRLPEEIRAFQYSWHTLTYPERDVVAYPARALKLMGIKKGDIVIDVNPGPGYWAFKIAKAVGPSGRVIGLQVCEFECDKMDAWVKNALADKKWNPYGNVIFRKDIGRIMLPNDSADVVLVSLCAFLTRNPDDIDPDGEVFSRTAGFQEQERILRDIYRVLKPGGRLVVIDILDTDVLRKRVPEGCEKENFFMSAERVDDVVKNYERIGFRKKAEYGIYRGPRHISDIRKVESSKNFKAEEWRAKITFASEKFFLVLEKPPAD